MATPQGLPPQRRNFFVEIWEENREVFKALVADTLLFLVAFAVLLVVFLGFRGLERAGYPPQRIATFETLHYWVYHGVLVIFLADLIVKLFVFLILRRKP